MITKSLHQTINKVTSDLGKQYIRVENYYLIFDFHVLGSFSFNTAISQLMILSNEIRAQTKLSIINELPETREIDSLLESEIVYESISTLLLMMSPMAPHFVDGIEEEEKALRRGREREE
jgi:leucyl-tRNA synthetase